MFKWTCLSVAVVFGVVLLVLIVDLKRDVTEPVQTINAQLPEIIGEVKSGTETLAGLAKDVELLKSLAGLGAQQSKEGFRGLATYADEVQKMLVDQTEGKGVEVLKEKLIGKKLEVVELMEEFLVGLSREMVTLVLLAKSKEEILDKACHARRPGRKPFYLKFPGEEPVLLEDFIRMHHPESAELSKIEE
jgi:hypothetical protein